MIKKFLYIILLFASLITIGFSQSRMPSSLDRNYGVSITSYDTLHHRSINHYEHLLKIFCNEYNINSDSSYLLIIFVDENIKDRLEKLNPGWTGILNYNWGGYYLFPNTIIIETESDDTFFHELMHYYHDRKLFLNNVPEDNVHAIIYKIEKLMLFSRLYIEYIQTIK